MGYLVPKGVKLDDSKKFSLLVATLMEKMEAALGKKLNTNVSGVVILFHSRENYKFFFVFSGAFHRPEAAEAIPGPGPALGPTALCRKVPAESQSGGGG